MRNDTTTLAEKEYLETIFWLEEAGLAMTGANLARAMQLSPPTVHEMIGRLVDHGYITRRMDKSLEFTADGRRHARELVRRHRLVERFLTDVLGMEWDDVHEEAARLEHAISPTVEARILAAVGDARTCPHGHLIDVGRREPGSPLSDVAVGARVRIIRFENEAERLLRRCKRLGLRPDLEGVVTGRDEDGVTLRAEGAGDISVTMDVAETVTVDADPAPPSPAIVPSETLARTEDRYGR